MRSMWTVLNLASGVWKGSESGVSVTVYFRVLALKAGHGSICVRRHSFLALCSGQRRANNTS
jgi:hypothetical protein